MCTRELQENSSLVNIFMLKKIYLDWSHLQPLIDNEKIDSLVFKDKYICISFNHIVDFSRGEDLDKLKKRAAFLDKLPNKLFLLGIDHLQVMEFVRAIEKYIGVNYVPEECFIKKHFYQIYNHGHPPELIEILKQDDSFTKFTEDLISSGEGKNLFDIFYSKSISMSKEIAYDRKQVKRKKLEEEHGVVRNQKKYASLAFFISQAIGLLVLYGMPVTYVIFRDNKFYLKTNGSMVVSLNDYFMQPNNLKFFHLFHELIFLRGEDLEKKDPLSKKFTKSAGSDFADYGHLHALICCDYVTCDRKNYNLIQNASRNLKITFSNLKSSW